MPDMLPERRNKCIEHTFEIKGIKEDTGETKQDVKEMMKILKGNGKIGLAAKVEVLWKASLFIVAAIVGISLRMFFL